MKKVFALVLALALLVPGFAFAEDDFSGTITISLYASTGVQEAWEAVGAAYEALHPGVDVVVDLKPSEGYENWVKAMFQSWDTEVPEADLVLINLAGSDANDKVINFYDYAYDINPYTDDEWQAGIACDMQQIDQVNGSWTALCVSGTQVLWFYNADIFEEVGVEPPTTWDEFVAVCEKIAAAGYQPLAVAGDFNSFWSGQMGWLAQIYVDQTTRSQIEIVRAQPGDYCYDEEIDGAFVYDPTDPWNDDTSKVTNNGVRFYKAFKEGEIVAGSQGQQDVWTNMGKLFPQYAGGDAFFGTDGNGAKTLFYQGKAAIWLDGSWFFGDYLNTMDAVAAGESVELDDETTIEGVQEFGLGTFSMPSMEGDSFEAPARTIEVATGFLGAVKKDVEHDDMVVDFLMYYSSPEGFAIYTDALIENGGRPDGIPLVNGVELEGELADMFSNITYIGNVQKGWGQALARGIGDNQEALRAWYTYTMDFLNGNITIEEWAEKHNENQLRYLPDVMAASEISDADLENPQNEPTGN